MSADSIHAQPGLPPPVDLVVSKTQKKKAMLELQELGAALAELSPERLRLLPLPEDIYQELRAVQSITKWEARRRQMQYIGKLMRRFDTEPIRQQLERWAAGPRAAIDTFHELERLREALLADPKELDGLVARFPQLDRNRFRALLDKARQEQEQGKPARFFRELFRELRGLVPETMNAE